MAARPKLTEQTDYCNTLYWGDVGTGKSTHLATLANLGTLVIVNAEGGIKKRPLLAMGIKVANIEVVQARTFEELEDLGWQLKGELEDKPGSIAGVGWDSVTELHMALLGIVRKDRYEKQLAKWNRQQVEAEYTRFFTDRGDWGEMSGQVKELLRLYIDLPCHFAMTALPRRDVDGDSGRVNWGPAVNPAIQGDITGMPDIVIETTVDDDGRFVGASQPTQVRTRKDRLHALPHTMVDPTMERVVGYVNDKISEDKDPLQVKTSKSRTASDDDDADAAEPKAPAKRTRPTPARRGRS